MVGLKQRVKEVKKGGGAAKPIIDPTQNISELSRPTTEPDISQSTYIIGYNHFPFYLYKLFFKIPFFTISLRRWSVQGA